MENFIFCAVIITQSLKCAFAQSWILYPAYPKITKLNFNKHPPDVFYENKVKSQENNCARISFLIKLQALGLF